jgi:hypothetical protein
MYYALCSGCGSFASINKIKFINLAAAGDAIDRLEGDSKINSWLATPLGEASAVFGTAQQKK